MTSKEELLADLDRPERLEARYRAGPHGFAQALQRAYAERPESIVLQIWHQRLFFRPAADVDTAARARTASLAQVVALCLGVGVLEKLPGFLPIQDPWYYARYGPELAILGLMGYFLLQRAQPAGLRTFTLGACAAALLYLGVLGDAKPDSVAMALIHAPLVFWSLLALCFLGARWRDPGERIAYVRYSGELFVIAVLLLLGGVVLSGVTLALFHLIGADIVDWYARWVVVLGLVSAPLVGTYLYETVFEGQIGIARVLANVFSPLFLPMVSVYLVAMIALGKSPYQEREFLMTFNGLLLLVLGMTIFSLVERRGDAQIGAGDYVSAALIAVTLAIDAVALSAILFRLGSQGWTANRAAVLGSNLLIFVHLLWLSRCHLQVIRGKRDFSASTAAIAGFLPLYAAWATFVTFLFPLLFRFR